ncbi:MAG: translation initiation factor IF-2 [Peptostreptococcaceae bacterium]|nr:translation initiation factor IF-2 [Peptostreptococcaceae bacterium]
MKKIRIYELAKDLSMPAKDLVEMLNGLGFNLETHMAAVTEAEAQQMMHKLAEASRQKMHTKPKEAPVKSEQVNTVSEKKNEEKTEEKKKESKEQPKEEKQISRDNSQPEKAGQKEKEKSKNLVQERKQSEKTNKPEKTDKEQRPKSSAQGRDDRKPREHQGDRRPREHQGDRRNQQGEKKGGYQGKQQGDKKSFQKGDKQFGQKRDFQGAKDKDSDERRPARRDFKRDSKSDPTKEELSVQIKKEEKRKELKIEEKKKQKDKKKVDNRFESGEVKYQRRDLSKKTHNKKKKDKTKHNVVEEEVQVFDGSIEDGMFVIGEDITVGKLAEILKVQATDVIMKLMKMGIMASINQDIRFETAEKIAAEYDIILMQQEVEEEDIFEMEIEEDNPEDLLPRAPIVTVMGHVDHGKTTLLDTIRSTGVALKEAGGITQHIGASEVVINGQKIVFLDTPGHEAFTEMRARGAKVTDIAIVVVAADDGIMPQTVEAINHVKAAGVPMIIAINKIDKPTANIERVRQELSGYDVLVESWGGDVIDAPVSAKAGDGIENLLNMVLLVAEVEELKANPNRRAVGSVIESNLDKGRGAVATILVQNGTLKVGDAVVAGASYGKVRAMINSKGNKTGKAGPSTAVEILGLSEVPNAGDPFVAVESDKVAREIAEKRKEKIREDFMRATSKIHLEDLFTHLQDGVKELNLIVKADVQGSIEALKGSLEKISNEEVIVRVIHGGVGAVTESDVMLASASNAIIIGFNVRPTTGALSLAEKEQVDIRSYSIIYQAIEEIETAMKGMLAPQFVEEQLGTAQVRMVFKVPGAGFAAGSYVTNGKITRNAQVRLVRDGIVIYDGKIDSLRRFKDEVKEVATGFECGISLERYSDIKENDIIEAYEMKEVKR